jgi:trans-AT polyketide synthase/acyltransferase/oxidoreductase domain-containing protein
MMTVFMFPGQGAQRLGMGRELFEKFPKHARQADAILGYSIAELCTQGPMEKLSQTEFTQPALYVVNCLQYLARVEEMRDQPQFLLGHSVSEYAALFAADVIDFEAGLRIVAKRGALMSAAAGGGMAAVLGLDGETVQKVLADAGSTDVFPANFNTPKQIVLSGRKDSIIAIEATFLNAGASHYKVLPVSGAFHTPFMAEAQAQFAAFVAGEKFGSQKAPVISNVTARPHVDEHIRQRMVEQITAPVRWSESIRYMLANGIVFADTCEIGPEGPPVVRPMFKRTEIEAGPLSQEELEKVVSPPADLDLPSTDISEGNGGEAPSVSAKGTESIVAKSKVNGAVFTIDNLGSRAFCEAFDVRYPYVSGAMYQGIASTALVVRMAQSGMLGFFGAAGLPTTDIQQAIEVIRADIPSGATFGVNFIAHFNRPHLEDELTDLLLEQGVTIIEASAFMEVTPALVRYRVKGLRRVNGRVVANNRIVAKVSRPDVAAQFLSPAPNAIVEKLLASQQITQDEAALLRLSPMADAITVESDSGGHTDQGMPFVLIPPILKLRDHAQSRFKDFGPIFVGSAGGIGTPEAAAAAFVLGADYIVTGSINQCTIEAGTSDAVKDLLEGINVYDTAYAPSGEMFELGSKIQVLKRGVFFPSRAEKLVNLYRQHDSIEGIEAKTRMQLEDRYFGRSLDDVFADVSRTFPASEIERANQGPKQRMAMIFKRYFKYTTEWALSGDLDHKVDFQVHCGPAQGAFNQWVAGGDLEHWRKRHVDHIGLALFEQTASLLNRRLSVMAR